MEANSGASDARSRDGPSSASTAERSASRLATSATGVQVCRESEQWPRTTRTTAERTGRHAQTWSVLLDTGNSDARHTNKENKRAVSTQIQKDIDARRVKLAAAARDENTQTKKLNPMSCARTHARDKRNTEITDSVARGSLTGAAREGRKMTRSHEGRAPRT